MIFLLDADGTGRDSISKRIASKQVTLLPCGSFVAYDAACMQLANRTPAPGDRVVLDTFSIMLSTTRGDFKHGNDPKTSVWEDNQKWFGDKQGMNAYQAASNMTMRWLRNLKNVGYDLVVLAQEDEALDEVTMTTKRAPKANPEALDMLKGSSTDIFRLIEITQDKTDTDGNVTVAKGERILLLRRTNDTLAKFHVDLEQAQKLPDGIKSPTFPKLCEVLGKTPGFLVVYGQPGVGKTTFSTS